MPGEHHLPALLRHLSPVLDPQNYVFCTLPPEDSLPQSKLTPLATVLEPEGLSVVVPKAQAESYPLGFEGTFRCIRLDVHSSLESVGLTATVATALAREAISANVIAGTFHDHILVPEQDAEAALRILHRLSEAASNSPAEDPIR